MDLFLNFIRLIFTFRQPPLAFNVLLEWAFGQGENVQQTSHTLDFNTKA